MSDQWSADPGAYPPAPSPVPSGWNTQPGHLAPEGPPPFGSGPEIPPLPEPPPRSPRTTRNLVIAIGVLTVLLLLATAGLVVVVRSGDDLAAGPTPSSTTTPPPSTPSPPSSTGGPSTPPSTIDPTPTGPPPSQAELDAEIADLSAFVERERGLEFITPVEVTMADEARFDELLFADFDEDAQSRLDTANVLKALGLVPADLDIDATLRQLLGAGVLGFYDPETGELVIRGQAITPYTRQTIVHELTHALDDQHFGLDRPQYDDLTDETDFGFSATVEGNARRVDAAYVRSLSAADQRRRDQEESQFGTATQPLLAGIPAVLLKILQAPYEYGQLFVEGLLQAGGQSLLDSAITLPPTTSTEVLHPDSFLRGWSTTVVDAPDADGQVVDEGVFGELMTQFTLEDSEGPAVAANASSGWAGDHYVIWEDGGGSSCIRIAYEMQTDKDLEELEDAYTSWAAPRGATVERVGERVEVTSCASSAAGSSPL